MAATVVGLFDSDVQALGALRELERSGFRREQVGIVRSAPEGSALDAGAAAPARTVAGERAHTDEGEGAVAGAEIGAGLGAIAGLLLVVVPGVGPIMAAGPILAALSGAAAGAVTGTLFGGLAELQLPHHHALAYEEGLRRGGTVVTAHVPESDAHLAQDILRRHGAVDIEQRAAEYGLQPGSALLKGGPGGDVSSVGASTGITAGSTPNTVAATTAGTAGTPPPPIPRGYGAENITMPNPNAGPNTGVPYVVPADVASSEPAWSNAAHEETPTEGDRGVGNPSVAPTLDDDTMEAAPDDDLGAQERPQAGGTRFY